MRYLALNLPYSRWRESWIRATGTWCPTLCDWFHLAFGFLTWLLPCQPPAGQSATALLLAHRFSTLPRKHHRDNSGSYCRLTPLPLAPTMGLRFKLGPWKRLTQNGLTARNPSHDCFSHCLIRKISILLKLNCYLGCVEVCAFATAKIRRLNGDAISKKTAFQFNYSICIYCPGL